MIRVPAQRDGDPEFRRCAKPYVHEAHGWIFTKQAGGGWYNTPVWCDGLGRTGDDDREDA